MSVGPLRRLTGAVGLVALVPTAWLLATNAITLTDAALRAGVTLVVVVAAGRLVGWVVGGLAGSFEREGDEAVPAGDAVHGASGAGEAAASADGGSAQAAASAEGGSAQAAGRQRDVA